MPDVQKMGRLAFRGEGKSWNCYYALPGTMEGALFLGSIALRFVDSPERKAQFMAVMRECFSDVMEDITGHRPTWPDPDGLPAPEAERTREA